MCFTTTFLDTVQVLARHECTYAIQVIAVHLDVKSGLLGGNQLEAIAALRRILEGLNVDCIEDVYKVLAESKVQEKLVDEQPMKKKQKYETKEELWAEGQALLCEHELVTDEQKSLEQEQQEVLFAPTSPLYSPTETCRRTFGRCASQYDETMGWD